MKNDYDFWFWLSVVANWCQIESWSMNQKQLKNEDLLKYLEHQDNDYLKTIVEQNDLIIKLLGGKI